jgi:hypothetical protein
MKHHISAQHVEPGCLQGVLRRRVANSGANSVKLDPKGKRGRITSTSQQGQE